MSTEGMKFDKDKDRYDLIQPLWVEEYVKVLTHGAQKYAAHNWRQVGDQKNRYYAALMRHIAAWWKAVLFRDEEGKYDKDSGLHHLAHAACDLAFLAEPELEKKYNVIDFRAP